MSTSYFVPFLLGPIRKVTLPGSAVPVSSYGFDQGVERLRPVGGSVGRPGADGQAALPGLWMHTGVLPDEVHKLFISSLQEGEGRVIKAATIVSYEKDPKVPSFMVELTEAQVNSVVVTSESGNPLFRWGLLAKTMRFITYS